MRPHHGAPEPKHAARPRRWRCTRSRVTGADNAGRDDSPNGRGADPRPSVNGEDDMPLSQLGSAVPLPASPAEAVLETFANPEPARTYLVRFTCPEFTCLCPVTGQPDFAHFVIDYAPAQRLVESKSLKLYLHAYRNHPGFHEQTSLEIARRLIEVLEPTWLRLAGYWYPRGGIPIDVFFQSADPPAGLWVPDPGVAPYRGRG